MNQSTKIYDDVSVPKLVAKNAIPAMLSMLVILIYNIADTFFVGQTGDPLQVAAVSLATPVFLLFMATGNLFGIGGTSVISRALGRGEHEYAKKVSSFCFYSGAIVGVIYIFLFSFFIENILTLIGTSANTIEYTREYLLCVMFSAPFVIISNAFSNIVRSEGKAKEAMVGVMVGTVMNIILDPIMILGLKLGIFGAALATVIGNIAGALYYVIYFMKKKSILSISFKDFSMKEKIFTGVMAIGLPAAFNNILMSVSNILLNNFLSSYGDNPVAAMGVATKVNMIVFFFLIGLGQGVQPLLGYFYGAKNMEKFRSIIKFTAICALVLGVSLTLVCWNFSGNIVKAFIDNQEVYSYGVSFVKAIMISGPFVGIMFLFINTLQAIGAATASLVLSISRQGFVFIPLLFILNHFIGLNGIVYSQPLADFIAIFLSGLLYYIEMKKFKKVISEKIPEKV
ncbi:MAG TPA: MATE family efflux transporter [Tepiditoga sp.]|nr:MATE family efflux transporter [Thermotogota bacterium]HOO73782.1 MATE family efflux transporter [Tepiditoga sp.]